MGMNFWHKIVLLKSEKFNLNFVVGRNAGKELRFHSLRVDVKHFLSLTFPFLETNGIFLAKLHGLYKHCSNLIDMT